MTPKQHRILATLKAAHRRGETPTLDLLIHEAELSASKQAAQQTLRTLERRGLLERVYERRGERVHLVLRLTSEGLRRAS